MRIFLVYAVLCFNNVTFANGREVFETRVHSFLKENCALCHDSGQRPFHSNSDLEVAYSEALPLIDVADVSNSTLWLRSYDGHCQISARCGTPKDDFRDAIIAWANAETTEEDEFEMVGSTNVAVPSNIGDLDSFDIVDENSEVYRFTVKRLQDNYLMVYNPEVGNFYTHTSFKGFELRTPDAKPLKQNFGDFYSVVKPTGEDFINLSSGKGYIFFHLKNPQIETIQMSLHLKERLFGFDRKKAIELYKEGYLVPREQFENLPKKLFLGFSNSCALFELGQIRCWGQNRVGNLGTESQNYQGDAFNPLGQNTLPTDVGPGEIEKISLGIDQSCVLFTSGKVKCWGYIESTKVIGDNVGEMGVNLPFLSLSSEKAIDISNGASHTCALFESRKVKCWGSNDYGQLGQGNTTSRIIFPPASGLNIPYINFGGELVDKLYSRGNFNCVILKSGQIKCWGYNSAGNLGLEDSNHRGDNPNEMGANLPSLKLGEEKPVEMALGSSSSCALFINGKVKCWGYGSGGQLGSGSRETIGLKKNQMGSNLPYVDLGDFKAVHIMAGSYSVCAVDESNRVKCWGENSEGNLGLGDTQNRGNAPGQMGENLPLLDFGNNHPSKWFNGGSSHTCFLSERSEIKCWGFGFRGVLGTEKNDNIGDQVGELASPLTSVDLGASVPFIEN